MYNKPSTLHHRLAHLMRDAKLFTHPGLKRRQVARLIYTNEMYLRSTILRYHGCTFSEYLTRQRLDYALQLMADPACRHLSLTAIALDAGFGSRWTFYRQFKERFGVTAEEYRRGIMSCEL